MQISQNLDYLTPPPGSNKLYKMIKELPHKAKPQPNKNQKMHLLWYKNNNAQNRLNNLKINKNIKN